MLYNQLSVSCYIFKSTNSLLGIFPLVAREYEMDCYSSLTSLAMDWKMVPLTTSLDCHPSVDTDIEFILSHFWEALTAITAMYPKCIHIWEISNMERISAILINISLRLCSFGFEQLKLFLCAVWSQPASRWEMKGFEISVISTFKQNELLAQIGLSH